MVDSVDVIIYLGSYMADNVNVIIYLGSYG